MRISSRLSQVRTWSSFRSFAVLLAVSVVLSGATLVAPPAEAVPGSRIIGHRCRTYSDPSRTNEDTVYALREVGQGAPGAWCEIDLWRLSDGTMIVFHDSTWNRVADLSTLPAGVQRDSLVKNATWAQVSQIRTKGGEPIPTLQQMIDASATYHVPLVAEVKNTVANPQGVVDYAQSVGASVRFYRQPGAGCAASVLDPLRKAGAPIGLKLIKYSDCSVADLAAKGMSFVTQRYDAVTTESVAQMKAVGVSVYARNVDRTTSAGTLQKGVEMLTCDNPLVTGSWPGT